MGAEHQGVFESGAADRFVDSCGDAAIGVIGFEQGRQADGDEEQGDEDGAAGEDGGEGAGWQALPEGGVEEFG